LSSALLTITEELKNVLAFAFYESRFLAFCEGTSLRVSENKVQTIAFGPVIKEWQQIRNNALKTMFKIFTLNKHC
jgi:hypothetical protein